MAAYAAIGVALVITVLITLLFTRMLIVKDRYAIAVMKAFGFTEMQILRLNTCRPIGLYPADWRFARHPAG